MDNNPVKRNESEEPSRFGSLKNEFVDNTVPTEQDSGDGWFKSVGSFLQQTGTDVADVVKDYKAQKGYIAPIDIALTTPYKLFYKNQQEKSKERTAYINQITDNNFQPYDNTFDDKIDNSVMLQSSLGFADTEDEYKKAIQNYLIPMPDGSDREIKIVKDDREDKPLFMPKFYVSVEEDDVDLHRTQILCNHLQIMRQDLYLKLYIIWLQEVRKWEQLLRKVLPLV